MITINKLRKKYNNICQYCGKHIPLQKGFAARDHILAKALGGKDNVENIILSCKTCNSIKSSRTLEQFRNIVTRQKIGCSYFNDSQYNFLFKTFNVDVKKYIKKNEVKFYFEKKNGVQNAMV